jgi:hypothetical protein
MQLGNHRRIGTLEICNLCRWVHGRAFAAVPDSRVVISDPLYVSGWRRGVRYSPSGLCSVIFLTGGV